MHTVTIAKAPDMTKLKNPKYDWATRTWIEMDGASQGAQIEELKEQLDQANKNNAQLVKLVAPLVAPKPTSNGGEN